MKENQKQNRQAQEHDALDRALDAALVKYASVSPRMGLEDRILANLQAQPEHADHRNRAWRVWGVAAAFATVMLGIIGLAWGPAWISVPRTPAIAHHPPATDPRVQLPAPDIAPPRPPVPDSTAKTASRRSNPSAKTLPKLDQFPSPQPLSEQEKILARYIQAYPEHAVLLARARTEALRRDQIEETQPSSPEDWATDSEGRKNDTSER